MTQYEYRVFPAREFTQFLIARQKAARKGEGYASVDDLQREIQESLNEGFRLKGIFEGELIFEKAKDSSDRNVYVDPADWPSLMKYP